MLITTSVISFCKDEGGSFNVKLWFLVVHVQCEVLCRSVVAGNVFLLVLISKGSQLLILTETRYQLQPSDKELHTQRTPLRTRILH